MSTPPEIPSFPSSACTSAIEVERFYAFWSNFSTTKSFTWLDEHPACHNTDRRRRCLMEKENRQRREEHIRGFNMAVRAFTVHLKKRNPRYLASPLSEVQRETNLRNVSAEQAFRARRKNLVKVRGDAVPEWARNESSEESDATYSTVDCLERFECVICKEIFWSGNSFASHEVRNTAAERASFSEERSRQTMQRPEPTSSVRRQRTMILFTNHQALLQTRSAAKAIWLLDPN